MLGAGVYTIRAHESKCAMRNAHQSVVSSVDNGELSIWRRMDSETVKIAISFMCACFKFFLRRSSQCYNTQRAWQPSWWGRNVWCLTVVGAVRRANRKLRNEPIVVNVIATSRVLSCSRDYFFSAIGSGLQTCSRILDILILQDKTLCGALEASNIVCWLVNQPIAKLDLFKSPDCRWICETYVEYCYRNSATVRRLVQSPTLQSTISCRVHSDSRGKGIRVSPASGGAGNDCLNLNFRQNFP